MHVCQGDVEGYKRKFLYSFLFCRYQVIYGSFIWNQKCLMRISQNGFLMKSYYELLSEHQIIRRARYFWMFITFKKLFSRRKVLILRPCLPHSILLNSTFNSADLRGNMALDLAEKNAEKSLLVSSKFQKWPPNSYILKALLLRLCM